MQTRSRKNVLQQAQQNPRAKVKKGSKTPEVIDVNESLKKIPVSPILGSRKRRQATQVTEQAIKNKNTSLQSKLKTAVFGSRKSQQAVKISSSTPQSKPATPVLERRKRQQAVQSNSSTSQSKPETPVFGSRKRQQTVKSNSSSSQSKSETPVLGSRKRQQTVKSNSSSSQSKSETPVLGSRKRQQTVKSNSSSSQSKSETPVLGSRKRQQTVKSNSSSSQSKSEIPVLGSRKRQQYIQVTDQAVKSSSSSSSQSKPETPALGGRKRQHAIQVTEQNINTSSSQTKHETPVLGSSKRQKAVQVAEQDVKSSSSSSQSKPNPKAKLQKGSKTPESKSKTPVWRKNTTSAFPFFDFKTKRQSARISLNKSKDIYEFPCEDNKENVIKKKRKPQVRRKKLKPKPKPILKTMLTTDPHFEPTIPNPITTSTFYAKKKDKVPSNIKTREMCSEIELADHSEVYSHCGDDIDADDAGYEASISVANDTEGTGLFLANTALSVFPTPRTNLYPGTSSTPLHHEIRCANNAESSCASLANPALSILPTPKTTLRYPGTSSTPFNHDERYDFNPFIKNREAVPTTHEEEVKLCFGFDDSKDVDIGISPVKKNKRLAILHQVSMASFSNVEEIDPVPTRFTSVSARSQVTNFKRPIGIEKTQQNVKKRFTSTKENKKKVGKKNSDVEHKHSKNDCDKSVLFDEELAEFNTETDRLKSPSKNMLNFSSKNVFKNIAGNSFSNSPEKSFTAPPRKSYDRKSLESVRQKFLDEFAGGYPTTDTDTENEDFRPPDRITKRKRKIVKTKATKSDGKPNVPQKAYPKKRGKINKENCTPPSVSSRKNQVRKNNTKNLDKTTTDWASDINSHFSEIEDMDLVIE